MISLHKARRQLSLFKSRRPLYAKHFDAANYMCNFLARDVLLWVLYCIWPNDEESSWKLIEEMSKDKFCMSNEKKKLKEFQIKKDINLEDCDVLFLKKLILKIFPPVTEACSNEIEEMRPCLNEFSGNRNKFSHFDEDLTNNKITDFENMKTRFISDSKTLIYSSQRISSNTLEDDAHTIFKTLKDELETSWPISLVDMDTDDAEIVIELNGDELNQSITPTNGNIIKITATTNNLPTPSDMEYSAAAEVGSLMKEFPDDKFSDELMEENFIL